MDELRFQVREQSCLPVGEYVVECQDVTLTEGKFGPQIRWRLLVDAEGGVELVAWTSTSHSLKSKAVAWYQAFCGDVSPGDVIDLRRCVGKTAIATILRKQGDEGEYNKVDDIRALPRRPQSGGGGGRSRLGPADEDALRKELEERIRRLDLTAVFATWWKEHRSEYKSLTSFAAAATQLSDEELVDLLSGDPFVNVEEPE